MHDFQYLVTLVVRGSKFTLQVNSATELSNVAYNLAKEGLDFSVARIY